MIKFIATAIWNTSERLRIPLPFNLAPFIFVLMIGSKGRRK